MIIGDKIYGPDESLYIEFIEQGTDRLESALPLKSFALLSTTLIYLIERFSHL